MIKVKGANGKRKSDSKKAAAPAPAIKANAGAWHGDALLIIIPKSRHDMTAMTKSYDAIVIGTGQAGPSLTARLAAAGMKVAVIERASFGGTCVNTGCIPTKTLVASAYAAYMAK